MTYVIFNLLTLCRNPLFKNSLLLRSKPYVEMIALMARYNPFAEHAGMTKVCESKPEKSILNAVGELEKLGFTGYLLAALETKIKNSKYILLDVKIP
jgi:hypothetical protein